MGLSNEERLIKMYWSIHNMVNESRNLPTIGYNHEQYARLRALCDRLWDSFLGRKTNGVHWFTGSSATNVIDKPDSPWAVALTHRFSCDRSQGVEFDNRNQEMEEYHKQYELDPDMADYPDDGGCHPGLAIEKLLLHVEEYGPGMAATYLIYAGTEDLSYALRRYDDAFMARYAITNKLIADIQGECFGLFAEHEEFAHAYLLNQIFEGMYAYGNPVRGLARHQNWHHKLPNAMQHVPLKDMRRWHLTVAKNPTPTDWVAVAMEIMCHDYHYEHQFKELIRVAGKRSIPLDEDRLRGVFDNCVKAHDEKSKRDAERYREEVSEGSLCAIHGYQHSEATQEKVTSTKQDEDPDGTKP